MSGWPAMVTSSRSRRCHLTHKYRSPLSRLVNRIRTLAFPAALCFGFAMTESHSIHAQSALSWEQIKARFESANELMKADAVNVDEMKAEEVTAFLRPNPQFTIAADGTQLVPHDGVWQPTKGTQIQTNFAYLHERQRKLEL